MSVAQIIDQVRELEPGELLVLRRILDEMVDASTRQLKVRRPYRLVAVDMGVPLVNIDKALDLASELDDSHILEQMGRAK